MSTVQGMPGRVTKHVAQARQASSLMDHLTARASLTAARWLPITATTITQSGSSWKHSIHRLSLLLVTSLCGYSCSERKPCKIQRMNSKIHTTTPGPKNGTGVS